MADVKRELGVIGLGRMGGGLALQARERGMKVVGFDSAGLREEAARSGIIEAHRLEDFTNELSVPRAIFSLRPGWRGSRFAPRGTRRPS